MSHLGGHQELVPVILVGGLPWSFEVHLVPQHGVTCSRLDIVLYYQLSYIKHV